MQLISLVWGLLAFAGMLVGFLPCLGALNWLVIPFAAIGLIIGIVALAGARETNRGGAIVGFVCCALAVAIGVVRLMLGGGIV